MFPTARRIGPFQINAYGVSLAAAFGLATFLALRRAGKAGIAKESVLDVSIIAVAAGLLGARFWYVSLYPAQFTSDPMQFFRIWQGGIAVQGGLIFGIAAAYAYLRLKRIDVASFADLAAPPLALGQAVGRIGCLLNGCCYGVPTAGPLALIFSRGSDAFSAFGRTPLLPTQAILSLGQFAFLAVLLVGERGPLRGRKGALMPLYISMDALLRFSVEFLRGDAIHLPMGLTYAQAVSAVIFLVSGAVLVAVLRTEKRI